MCFSLWSILELKTAGSCQEYSLYEVSFSFLDLSCCGVNPNIFCRIYTKFPSLNVTHYRKQRKAQKPAVQNGKGVLKEEFDFQKEL